MRVLSKIKGHIKSDTSRDSFYSITGQAVAAIAGAVFFAFAARLLTLREFGLLSLALATAAIIKDVIDPSLNSALIKFIARGDVSARHVTRYVFQIKLTYFGFILAVGFLLAPVLSKIVFKEELVFLMLLTIVTSAVISAGSMLSGFMQGSRMFLRDAIFVAAQPLFRLVFLGGAFYFGFTNLNNLVVINALAYLVIIGLFASVIGTEFLTGHVPKNAKISANKFIGPLTISTITGTLTNRVGLYITNYLLGPAQVALLAAVMRLFIPAQQIAGVLNSVFGSRFARFTKKDQVDDYLKKSLLLVVPVVLGAIVISFFAPLVLQLIYGVEYREAAPLLRIITLGFAAFLFQVPFVAKLIYYKGRTDVLVYISVLQFILTLVFNWVFISLFSLNGAAMAIGVTMMVIALVYGVITQKARKK